MRKRLRAYLKIIAERATVATIVALSQENTRLRREVATLNAMLDAAAVLLPDVRFERPSTTDTKAN